MFRKSFLSIALLCLPVFAQTPLEQAKAAATRGDYAQAIAIYEKLAAEGDAKAQHNLAVMYDMGLGVAVDRAKGKAWMEKAAAQKLPEALYSLGVQTLYGETGIVQFDSPAMQAHNQPPQAERARGLALLQEAAELGSNDAARDLAQLYRFDGAVHKDGQKVLYYLEKSIMHGDSEAMYEMADVYVHGMQGVTSDCRKALYWYGKAAQADYIHAYDAISYLYKTGHCLPKSDGQSEVWDIIGSHFMMRTSGAQR